MLKMIATALLLAIAPGLALAATGGNPQLERLIEEFEAFRKTDDPLQYAQENPAAPLMLPDVAPVADARRKVTLEELQKRLAALDHAKLTADETINRDFLRRMIAD